MRFLPPAQPPRVQARSVAVIGAGPSGLAAAKYLVGERAFARIAVLEQRSRVGGLWNYTPHAGPEADEEDEEGEEGEEGVVTSAVYDALETNIPRGLMRFSDLEWPADCALFPAHGDVLAYLERYAQDVLHLIRFRTRVVEVRPREEEDGGGWVVRTRAVGGGGEGGGVEEVYDAVVVASGHHDVPYMPDVAGIERWKLAYPGRITHSQCYRRPDAYAGRKVVVVGNSASGVDIGAQIAAVCRPPLVVSRRSESYLNVAASHEQSEKPEIVAYRVQDRAVEFADGTVETGVDAVVYCTGYLYRYPFLAALDPPVVGRRGGRRVENVYHHIFYRPRPTLAFLALNQRVIPFAWAEVQSALVARVLSGRLALPGAPAMQAWEDARAREAAATGTAFHALPFPRDADDLNLLHDWALSADDAGAGKRPPRWGEEQYWIRERFSHIKKAFNGLGDARHRARTLQDVGFDYEAWRRGKDGEEEHVL